MRTLLNSTGGESAGETTLGVVLGCLTVFVVMGALLALCGKKSTNPDPQPDPSANSAEIPIHGLEDKRPEQKEGHEQVIVNGPHPPAPEWHMPSTGAPQDHQHGGRPTPVTPQPTAPQPPRQPPQPNPPARVWLPANRYGSCLALRDDLRAFCTNPVFFLQISPSSQGYPPVDAYENTDLSGTQGDNSASVARIIFRLTAARAPVGIYCVCLAVSAPIGTQAESTVEDTIRTLHQVCDVMGGAIQPQCYLHQGTIRCDFSVCMGFFVGVFIIPALFKQFTVSLLGLVLSSFCPAACC